MRNDKKVLRKIALVAVGLGASLGFLWVAAPLLPLEGKGPLYRRVVVIPAFLSGITFSVVEYYPQLYKQRERLTGYIATDLFLAAFAGFLIAVTVPVTLLIIFEIAGIRGQYTNAAIAGYVTGAIPPAFIAIEHAIWEEIGP